MELRSALMNLQTLNIPGQLEKSIPGRIYSKLVLVFYCYFCTLFRVRKKIIGCEKKITTIFAPYLGCENELQGAKKKVVGCENDFRTLKNFRTLKKKPCPKWPRARDMRVCAPKFLYQKMLLILGYIVCKYHSLTPDS